MVQHTGIEVAFPDHVHKILSGYKLLKYWSHNIYKTLQLDFLEPWYQFDYFLQRYFVPFKYILAPDILAT